MFRLAIMPRRRKLIDMTQDDLSQLSPADPGRSCSSPPRWFKAQIEAGLAGETPRRGDVWMCVIEPGLTEAARD
jgi:hypothetical protein